MIKVDRWTVMTKVPGNFRDYANAPKNTADKIITARRQNWAGHKAAKE